MVRPSFRDPAGCTWVGPDVVHRAAWEDSPGTPEAQAALETLLRQFQAEGKWIAAKPIDPSTLPAYLQGECPLPKRAWEHPRTIQLIEKYQINITSPNLFVLPPVSYLEMLYLLDSCKFVLTDSGGLQKEAYFLKKLCLTLRNETEWVELIAQKANIIVGNSEASILNAFNEIDNLFLEANFEKELYGSGDASGRIIDSLEKLVLKEKLMVNPV